MKFRVGDPVRFCSKDHPFLNGITGVVIEIRQNGYIFPYRVQFKDPRDGRLKDCPFTESEIEALTESLDD